ncbi:sigma-70 family RNA polymerase sigma factor [Plantactinospora sp. S1510]|uniref:Sigma-70 family RNA polymerase sigma factor n=1 Tax=Plantactinospora alkalitolerans TaxID=2789879 RepID=A0ABS0H6J2_9ACTN|nr:sigma-70 family RNA polymerase sigma factor [Plantactinospora alkalitolerans]MBF9134081.1 sigma-70 family RNA polymerase sigma factor [Plantactinospora alkalitolerans]
MSGDDAGGRADRFRSLHLGTYADLLRFVERRVPGSEAEDVVSTVFMTAWRRFDELPDDARPWLFAVARKTMANRTRGWLRRQALDVRLGSLESPELSDDSAGAAVRIDLERAWKALSAADREVLALVAFDGLTAEQAADVLGCRRSTFAMRLGRARKRLQSALEPAEPDTRWSSRPHPLKEQQSWTRA